jgi:hypothetical protein
MQRKARALGNLRPRGVRLGLLVKNFLEGVDHGSLPFNRAIGYSLKCGLRTADYLNLFDATDK